MHVHVTGFRAATILVFAIASPSRAQGIEVFGGYSVNADYVQNRPAILVVDQKVSPFFSLGSGPAGTPYTVSTQFLIALARRMTRCSPVHSHVNPLLLRGATISRLASCPGLHGLANRLSHPNTVQPSRDLALVGGGGTMLEH